MLCRVCLRLRKCALFLSFVHLHHKLAFWLQLRQAKFRCSYTGTTFSFSSYEVVYSEPWESACVRCSVPVFAIIFDWRTSYITKKIYGSSEAISLQNTRGLNQKSQKWFLDYMSILCFFTEIVFPEFFNLFLPVLLRYLWFVLFKVVEGWVDFFHGLLATLRSLCVTLAQASAIPQAFVFTYHLFVLRLFCSEILFIHSRFLRIVCSCFLAQFQKFFHAFSRSLKSLFEWLVLQRARLFWIWSDLTAIDVRTCYTSI